MEAIHQGVFGSYLIGPLLQFSLSLIQMAVVTVLVSGRLEFTLWFARVCLSFPSVDSPCVPFSRHCHLVLDSLILVVPLLGSLAVTHKNNNWVVGL